MIIEEIRHALSPENLAAALHGRRGFFFLDSARPEEKSRRAFSFIGFEPFLVWRAKGDRIVMESANSREEEVCHEPLAHLRELMARYPADADHGLPFSGGAVGYFGYEFGARNEGVPSSVSDDPDMADALFGFYDGIIACDLTAGKTFAVANPVADQSGASILDRLREAIDSAKTQPGFGNEPCPVAQSMTDPLASNFTREAYLDRVMRIKDYIAAGDVYQVNLAQRFERVTTENPFAIYRRLRALNPAPFGAYIDAGGSQILSSSPELLVRIDSRGRVLTRPIKGTRRRGSSPAEDRQMAAELATSEKDHAELLMIVDLERNDLGRVCRYGSVRVEERHRIETHPTVFHLVATISGQLAEGRDRFDCLRSMLPGGSITGAPKIRAMQIIDELEPCRRNVYTGSIGYLGFDGACDLNIAIRTIICRAGRASYHVGGGIVSDSIPEAEYEETLAKGRALRVALLGENQQ